jgi:hypothetical protein
MIAGPSPVPVAPHLDLRPCIRAFPGSHGLIHGTSGIWGEPGQVMPTF